MAVARPPSRGSRQRNNLEHRSRESPAWARDPHHGRHRLPRQGGAHDAARPVSRGGKALRPGAAARRRHRGRPLFREGRVVSALPPLARAARRRIRRVPPRKMRPAGRRRNRSAARPVGPAGRRVEGEARLRDQLGRAGHLQSFAGARGQRQHRGREECRRPLQGDRRHARPHLHLLRRRSPAGARLRGRAAGGELPESARSRPCCPRSLLRRRGAEGRRRAGGEAAGAGRRQRPGGAVPGGRGEAPGGGRPGPRRRKGVAPGGGTRAQIVALAAAGAGQPRRTGPRIPLRRLGARSAPRR